MWRAREWGVGKELMSGCNYKKKEKGRDAERKVNGRRGVKKRGQMGGKEKKVHNALSSLFIL